MGGPFGQWAHQYDVPPQTHRVVREVWLPRATNIQATYVDYVPFLFSLATFFLCEDNKPIDLVILYCVVMPFYPSSTKRHETCRGYTPQRKPAGSITRPDLAVYLRPS